VVDVGSVVKELLKRGAKVRVLARKQPEEGRLPAGVEIAIGDLLHPDSLEKAMKGIADFSRRLFVLPFFDAKVLKKVKAKPGLNLELRSISASLRSYCFRVARHPPRTESSYSRFGARLRAYTQNDVPA
jgi:hypothetical protein